MASRYSGMHRMPSASLSVVSSVRRHPLRSSGTVLGATVLMCLAGPAYAADSTEGVNPPPTQTEFTAPASSSGDHAPTPDSTDREASDVIARPRTDPAAPSDGSEKTENRHTSGATDDSGSVRPLTATKPPEAAEHPRPDQGSTPPVAAPVTSTSDLDPTTAPQTDSTPGPADGDTDDSPDSAPRAPAPLSISVSQHHVTWVQTDTREALERILGPEPAPRPQADHHEDTPLAPTAPTTPKARLAEALAWGLRSSTETRPDKAGTRANTAEPQAKSPAVQADDASAETEPQAASPNHVSRPTKTTEKATSARPEARRTTPADPRRSPAPAQRTRPAPAQPPSATVTSDAPRAATTPSSSPERTPTPPVNTSRSTAPSSRTESAATTPDAGRSPTPSNPQPQRAHDSVAAHGTTPAAPAPVATAPSASAHSGSAPLDTSAARPVRVAGPDQAAPPASKPPAQEPVGPAARTVAAYPDVASGPVRPAWASGIALGSGTPQELGRMRSLAGARGSAFDVVGFDVPARSWSELTAPVPAPLRQAPGRKVLTVPLVPAGASLTACAKGDYHSYWNRFATNLKALGAAPVVSIDRFDATDAAHTDAAAYAACFRQVAATVRAGSPHARLQWNVARGQNVAVTGPASPWPGRASVDIVGIDAVDAGTDWTRAVNGAHGLTWWTDFAARQGRRVAIAPWGHFPGSPTSAVNAAYVQNMRDFLVRIHRKDVLAYEVYDASAVARGAAAEAYRKLF